MSYEEQNSQYRTISGKRADFYCIVTHPALKKRNIRAMGVDAYKNGVNISPFPPKWHQLIYITHGSFCIHFDDKTLRVEQGEILVMPAQLERRLSSDCKEVGWLWIHLEDVPRYTSLKALKVQKRACSEGKDIMKLYALLRRESQGSILINSYIEIISEKLLRLLMDHEMRLYEAEFNELWQQVRERPDAPWSVDMVCREMTISKAHLHKLCSSYFNSSPMEIITDIRLEYGAFLLKASNKVIDDIAYLCGFSSGRSFSKAFLKKYKIRPGKFRRDD
ncbi:MAG: AraC family transcriptional regulator [Lentisphaeraceae bacterium]|nr:AraC family transcriptional regulator [Lentisphaeraceae bacterium]